jgi:MmyB-like transcription regulator ligand binding domain
VRGALGDGQVGHEVIGPGAVPVLFAVGREDDIARAEFDDLVSARLDQAFGDVQGLPSVVGMPGTPRSGREVNRGHVELGRRQAPGVTGRHHPYDRRLSDLIGELSTRSDEFRVRWAAHNVKFHRTGTKQLHHPIVGGLTLAYEALELPADHGQRILVYTAEPGSPSDDALTLLATWSATTPLTEPHTDAAR